MAKNIPTMNRTNEAASPAKEKPLKRRNNTEQCFLEYISPDVILQCECNWVTDIK